MAFLIDFTIIGNRQLCFSGKERSVASRGFDSAPKTLAAGQVPEEAYVSWRHATLPDFGLIDAWWAVSQRVRDYLALLDPGAIQFVPFRISRRRPGKELLGSDGTPIDHFYVMNILARADAIAIDRCRVRVGEGNPPFVFSWPGKEGEVVLDKSVIQGRHIWKGYRHDPHSTFISDHLAQWFVREGFDHYFRMTHMREV